MLFLTSTLTHLGAASVKLSISALDGGGLTSLRSAQVTINILRSAQAPAVFQRSRYSFTVPEDAPPGTSVGTVAATHLAGERAFLTMFSFARLGGAEWDVGADEEVDRSTDW